MRSLPVGKALSTLCQLELVNMKQKPCVDHEAFGLSSGLVSIRRVVPHYRVYHAKVSCSQTAQVLPLVVAYRLSFLARSVTSFHQNRNTKYMSCTAVSEEIQSKNPFWIDIKVRAVNLLASAHQVSE